MNKSVARMITAYAAALLMAAQQRPVAKAKEEKKAPGQQRTTGSNSPIVSGDRNTFNYTINTYTDRREPPIQGPRFVEKIDNPAERKLTVSLGTGGAHQFVQLKQLKNGPVGILGLSNASAITIELQKGMLVANVNVPGSDGRNVIEIYRNQFKVNAPHWDRNSDQHAIEVVNEHGDPVFQMIYLDDDSLRINGEFMSGGIKAQADDTGLRLIPTSSQRRLLLKKLFKYPSVDFPHLRAVTSPEAVSTGNINIGDNSQITNSTINTGTIMYSTPKPLILTSEQINIMAAELSNTPGVPLLLIDVGKGSRSILGLLAAMLSAKWRPVRQSIGIVGGAMQGIDVSEGVSVLSDDLSGEPALTLKRALRAASISFKEGGLAECPTARRFVAGMPICLVVGNPE